MTNRRKQGNCKLYCVFDIGSVSVRYYVGCEDGESGLKILGGGGKISYLSKGLTPNGFLTEDSMADTLEAISVLNEELRPSNPSDGVCLGTHSLRSARNGSEFAGQVEKLTGLPMEILSSDREGALAWKGSADLLRSGSLLFDLGGGSTECSYQDAASRIQTLGIPIGSGTRLISQHSRDVLVRSQRKELLRVISHSVRGIARKAPRMKHRAHVVLGGTATALAALSASIPRFYAGCVHGSRLDEIKVRKLFIRLAKMTLNQKKSQPGLDNKRAEVITTGAAILLTILNEFEIEEIIVSEHGISHGRLRELISAENSRVV